MGEYVGAAGVWETYPNEPDGSFPYLRLFREGENSNEPYRVDLAVARSAVDIYPDQIPEDDYASDAERVVTVVQRRGTINIHSRITLNPGVLRAGAKFLETLGSTWEAGEPEVMPGELELQVPEQDITIEINGADRRIPLVYFVAACVRLARVETQRGVDRQEGVVRSFRFKEPTPPKE
jgi:hypothetical protein